MKRIVIYIILLAVLWLVPVKGSDVGKLQPVEVVFIYRDQGQIIMETDTKDKGVGATVEEALANLKDTTPGIIYLDTAEYLLLAEDTTDVAEQLRRILKKTVQICTADRGIDLSLVARFLPAHSKLPQFKQWQQGEVLPHLTKYQNRLKISRKSLDKGGFL
ncbi:MAG: hypothetical protein IJB47_00005 [Oscillospiraceae bacterium]|nr:hypothetical protein [Oscillospiraceae bacterium]